MEGVIKKSGSLPGKTVAVIGGVHGNERVGIEAVRWATTNVVPKRGTVYFIEANPAAILKNVRLIGKNLNRCFIKGNSGETPEDVRARELMGIFDECDALLDIHSSNSRETTPFAVCEGKALELVKKMDFEIVSAGWDALEPGSTDGYLHRNGKVGICIECGSVFETEKNLLRAKNSLLQFLQYFGLIDEAVPYAKTLQRHILAHKVAHKKTENFSFAKDYKDFEPLTTGEIFARDGDTEYVAEKGDCIIFPRPNTKIGSEAFILGKATN
jgi:succinylglutamate desuccinylase